MKTWDSFKKNLQSGQYHIKGSSSWSPLQLVQLHSQFTCQTMQEAVKNRWHHIVGQVDNQLGDESLDENGQEMRPISSPTSVSIVLVPAYNAKCSNLFVCLSENKASMR